MSKRSKHYLFMGKISYVISVALMIVALASNLLPLKAVQAVSQGKVYVCKFVGQPGVDEQLQTGQNPIEVSVYTIPEPVVIGSYFPDKQGRSFVLGFVPMTPEPTSADCPPPFLPGNASVMVTAGICSWTPEAGSLTPVRLELTNAALTINGVTYIISQTINLPPGSYPYTWNANIGYTGSGSGTLVIGECAPGTASAVVTAGLCSWTPETGSQTPVTVDLSNASLTINGMTYIIPQTINLPPGSYPYTWTANLGYTGSGSGTLVINDCTPEAASASVTPGTCIWTQAAGSLTPVTLSLSHATLMINGATYTTSQAIDLPPGSYPYAWTAESGYIGNGSGTIVVGDCTPGAASASVNPGNCSWDQAAGSLTPVSIDLNNASLTINGVTYTSSQSINLAPGSYPYTWTAVSGYIGNGSGTVVLGDCTPGTASATVTTGACGWSQESGSLTPMTLDLSNAALTINGITYTTSQSINLIPGSYPYTWTANSGYLGNGSGTVIISDCTPGTASATVTAGACGWSEAAGSQTPVTLDLSNAALTINGTTYATSQAINLAPGSYPYSWTAGIGYIGNGSGTLDIGDCTPGKASGSVVSGTCSWSQVGGALTPVSIILDHATLTIDGVTYTTSQAIDLRPGSYPYSWTAESEYIGNESGTLVVGDCTPLAASASVTAGACSWNQEAGALTSVSIVLEHAELTVNGATFTASQAIDLAPGSYPYTWTAESGYSGDGSGTLVVGDCTPGAASASVSAGACNWSESAGSLTPVDIDLSHAALAVNGVTYTASQSIDLAPGSYPYTWTAESGYLGNGSGTIIVGDCTPGAASVSVTSAACHWTQAVGSLTPVTLDLNHAALTINGVTYIISQNIDLAPGSYPYTWTAMSGYTGNGNGTLEVGDCTPGTASAIVTVSACAWTQEAGSLTPVTLALDHAELTINAVAHTTSQTINLPPGSYPYDWTAESGYIGNGNGTIVVGDCKPSPASASVTAGTCSWSAAAGSRTSASIAMDHASLTINDVTYIIPQTINLPPGSYPYTWTAFSGYTGSEDGTLIIGDCPPSDASASISAGACTWTQATGSLTPAYVNLNRASLTVNGVTYITPQTINLPPGSYPYTWAAVSGYTGSGSGTLVTYDCPTILIPVSGVDRGWLNRILPGSLFGLSFSFIGLGTILVSLARRRKAG